MDRTRRRMILRKASSWVAVLDQDAAAGALRHELRDLPIRPGTPLAGLPSPGDRVLVLALPKALVLEVATVARVRENGQALLHVRDRIRAPAGHEVDPFALHPRPACALSWTRGGLAELAGSFIKITESDGARFEAAVRAQALAFGPAPRRPAHDRPRTPGRRALGEGRAASGTLGGSRR